MAVTMYSSNYSPRIVQNFKEKNIFKSIRHLLGGFIYSITSLLFMRDSLYTDHVVSASIGVLYAIVSSILLCFFIAQVAKSSQASYLIGELTEELIRSLMLD